MKKLLLALLISVPAYATVNDTTGGRVPYTGNGVTAVYSYAFPVTDISDVQVYLNGTLTSAVTVSRNADQNNSPGGVVTFNAAPANGAAIIIQRTLTLTQKTIYAPFSPFPAKTTEKALDRNVLLIQQIDRDRADLAAKEAADVSNVIAGGVGAANLISPTATGTTTPQTLADRFAFLPNIKNWGAACNGVTSDNAAFTAAEAGTATEIYLPSGSACVTTGLTLKKKYFGPGSLSVNGALKFFGDVKSIRSFGAAGDGATSDNAAFTAAEADVAPDIYLPAGNYLTTGLALKKRYLGPGVIVLDGINRYGWSVERGRALALDYVSKIKSQGLRSDKVSVITRKDVNTLLAYRPMGGPFWEEATLTTAGIAGGPYSWNRTRITQFMSYLALALNGSLAYTGAWSTLDSGDPALYVGGHVKWTQTVTDHVDLTFSGGGDLYVIFIGRTSGGYVKPVIDGSNANANALPVGGTGNYHFLDTYNSVDLTYKTTVKVATGLASGSHTISLILQTDRNAGNVSGGVRFYFNGIALVGKDQGLPSQANTQTPQWVTGATYVTDDWTQNAGNFYFATGGGVAGANAPTCTVGTCSDGTVTWQFSATSSYDLRSHIIQDAGSQLEYAYQIKPTGASVFDDVGGVVHGNENLTALAVDLDGQNAGTLAQGSWYSADTINVNQAINATHSQLGATVIATQALTHRINFDSITVLHSHTWNLNAAIGWYYTAMWPLLAWAVPAGTPESFKFTFDNLFTPQGGKRLASAYYGQNNPIVGRTPDFYMQASGGVLQPAGVAGAASAVAPTYTAIAGLYVPPPSLDEFRSAGSLYAGMAMNLSNVTPPGFSSDVLKMYFERVPDAPTVSVTAGDVWGSEAVYYLTLVPSYPIDPTK